MAAVVLSMSAPSVLVVDLFHEPADGVRWGFLISVSRPRGRTTIGKHSRPNSAYVVPERIAPGRRV